MLSTWWALLTYIRIISIPYNPLIFAWSSHITITSPVFVFMLDSIDKHQISITFVENIIASIVIWHNQLSRTSSKSHVAAILSMTIRNFPRLCKQILLFQNIFWKGKFEHSWVEMDCNTLPRSTFLTFTIHWMPRREFFIYINLMAFPRLPRLCRQTLLYKTKPLRRNTWIQSSSTSIHIIWSIFIWRLMPKCEPFFSNDISKNSQVFGNRRFCALKIPLRRIIWIQSSLTSTRCISLIFTMHSMLKHQRQHPHFRTCGW